jgi:hypothetical protein
MLEIFYFIIFTFLFFVSIHFINRSTNKMINESIEEYKRRINGN